MEVNVPEESARRIWVRSESEENALGTNCN